MSSVKRISKLALDKIVAGKVREPATCVVKFYSNGCHMCHNLQEYYELIAEEEAYSELHFFAFNVDEYPKIEKMLGFSGVPTIMLMKVGTAHRRMRIMPEPEKPNEQTWYRAKDIKNFLDREI